MIESSIKIETTVTLRDLLSKQTNIDSKEYLETIMDIYEDWNFDCKLLNQLVLIMLSNEPIKSDISTLDISKLQELLDIYNGQTLIPIEE